jgi:DNA ligase-1
LPIDSRNCKHLRRLRGDAAEAARIGGTLSVTKAGATTKAQAPTLLLAENWNETTDPTGWWLSEKLDGVRAYWDGARLCSRQGHTFHAPTWFIAGLPDTPLDGELWMGRKQFQRTVSIVRRQDGGQLWQDIHFLIFDAPSNPGAFEQRMALLQHLIGRLQYVHARPHLHSRCSRREHLHDVLSRIASVGGEGVMLRQPGSPYVAGRSSTLLKVKRFHDAEAIVRGYEPGKGRHEDCLGALLVEMANGIRFALGTGFSDAERSNPPPIGSTITFRFQELSDAGVPRFSSYAGIRTQS